MKQSCIANCSIHHANNRAIAVHGVEYLTVKHNVLLDIRGHAIFIEDGTETRNTIAHNLIAVVRPVWSLLLVDQSPAALWIVNPDNDVIGNVVAGSSHYGIWYRALEKPDGISGQTQLDEGEPTHPNWTPLATFRGNVAHSVGRNGLKVSDYFPAVGGALGATDTEGQPAVFGDFVAYKTGRFGIWGEFLVDVGFDDVRLLDHGIAGIEFLYMNGRDQLWMQSAITNSLFVGKTQGPPASAFTGLMCEGLQDVNGAIDHDGMGCIHALHLPSRRRAVVANNTFVNYEAAMYPASWAIGIVGGYTVDCWNVSYVNVSRPITVKIGFSGRVDTAGVLIDHDGTLAGVPGGAVAPYTGQFANNPDCTIMYDELYDNRGAPEWVACKKPVRRIGLKLTPTSGFVNFERLYRFPHVHVFDVTDYDATADDALWGAQNAWGEAPQPVCSIHGHYT